MCHALHEEHSGHEKVPHQDSPDAPLAGGEPPRRAIYISVQKLDRPDGQDTARMANRKLPLILHTMHRYNRLLLEQVSCPTRMLRSPLLRLNGSVLQACVHGWHACSGGACRLS